MDSADKDLVETQEVGLGAEVETWKVEAFFLIKASL